ncbi:tetratricopeptide repeat protein [Dyadobacter chenhuakuii]|uniref:Tetratricopeptide repeat protein n=1 Tax=Dyadobacter chenhuakuii TaxID=2909339 RepID=A0A9X1TRU7_9BACT|nr:tetratricopeptide repeat protein [Dyadobacter chenhuakuii]MCF2498339.1 tetratricopeptide repeat protein [Dyadobacter chenhuakuii]
MNQIQQLLITESQNLYNKESFADLIALLDDEIIDQYGTAQLLALKAAAYQKIGGYANSLRYANAACSLDPQHPQAFFLRGNAQSVIGKLDEAILDYNLAISLKSDYKDCYTNRGYCWIDLNLHEQAISDFSMAISINPDSPDAYINRGNAFIEKKEYFEGIDDFKKALLLDPNSSIAYNNLGRAHYDKDLYGDAIIYFDQAIQKDSTYSDAYFNRALAYRDIYDYDKSIDDFLYFSKLVSATNPNFADIAKNEIYQLELKKYDSWYDNVDRIIQKIKKVLLFDKSYVTHYTSMSSARHLILFGSPMRLSEGAFLNDSSEGTEIHRFLGLNSPADISHDAHSVLFQEKSFIGSFVADDKDDDLTLWRMYGKEAQYEAKGCALTFHKDHFLHNLDQSVRRAAKGDSIDISTDEQFVFYRVAYIQRDKFVLPDKMQTKQTKNNEKQLNALMKELKSKVSYINKDQKQKALKLMQEIVYLFKSSEYRDEHEVRLVVRGDRFEKKILKEETPPRVYVDLVSLPPVVQKITIGPKVEKAEEWAAAFNYHIKAEKKFGKEKTQIVISRIPFR